MTEQIKINIQEALDTIGKPFVSPENILWRIGNIENVPEKVKKVVLDNSAGIWGRIEKIQKLITGHDGLD
jgi:hypothetical protein